MTIKDLERKIGFDVLRADLVERCHSPLGMREVEAMAFSSDYRVVVESLRQVDEMKGIYERGEDLPEVPVNDLQQWLPRLRAEGSYASAAEFASLRRSLKGFEVARLYFTRREGGLSSEGPFLFPYLAVLFSELTLFPDLVRAADRVVDPSGYVKDSASPELAEVRRSLQGLQGSIARAVQRVLSRAVAEGIADKEASPTFREGRVVIPVPAGNKRRLSGIVHDESATGKTVFIEPAETVELSNRIRELEMEEQRIIVKILTELSGVVRPEIEAILAANLIVGKMDFIMAKARFAIDLGGQMPVIEKNPEIDWYGAVHPVLLLSLRKQGRKVVPLNLRLDGRKRFLIISGPNAGGKSVALKTVGIVQYMCQCGLLPTLHSNSHIGLFSRIYIDIGDEQSIENDLSTYSSHLKNMRFFLLHADKRTLVLIDEIGSGTEPTIGAALARAILAELARSRCFGIVTTHYHNLKQFAEESETFVNGAMLYDRAKLQPTFQLSIGNPGSSFALEIAGKIGLPRTVIEQAKAEVGEEYVESDRFLMEIARDRKYWQSKRDQVKERENRLEAMERQYEKLISDLNQKRKEIIREAQNEARELLSGANKKIENTIRDIREAEAEKERTKALRRQLEEFKQEVESADDKELRIKTKRPKSVKRESVGKGKKSPSNASSPKQVEEKATLEVGSYVKMVGSTTVGRILSISGKEAEVGFGLLRTKVKLDRLTPAAAPKESRATGFNVINGGGGNEARQRQLEFKDELDIRGMRADEALDRVTHFIDDAMQFGVKRVRVLHGTGGGILRQLVRQQLSATPGIATYRDEDVRLGGAGITVVDL